MQESGFSHPSESFLGPPVAYPMFSPELRDSVAESQPVTDSPVHRSDFDDPPVRGSFIMSKAGSQDLIQPQKTIFWEPAHRDSIAPTPTQASVSFLPDNEEEEAGPRAESPVDLVDPVDPVAPESIDVPSSPLAAPTSPSFSERAAVRRSAFAMLDEALEKVATQEHATGQPTQPMDTFDMMELMVSQALEGPQSPLTAPDSPEAEPVASQPIPAPVFLPKGASKALAAFQEAVADGLSLEAATSPLETESWRALLHPVVTGPQPAPAVVSPQLSPQPSPQVSAEDLSGLIKPKAPPQAGRGRGALLTGEPLSPGQSQATPAPAAQPVANLPPALLDLKSQDLTSLFFILEEADLQPLRQSLKGLSAESLRPTLANLSKEELIRLIGQLSALL